MTDATPWWESIQTGQTIALAFVKIDRVASTRDWTELSPEHVDKRYARYTAGVEAVARAMNAAQPLHWQGDGVMLFLAGDDTEPAPIRGFRAAKLLWERMTIDLGVPIRIAVHAAHVAWVEDTGKLHDPGVDRCGHLEQVAPENSIAVSEDVCLALPDAERRGLAPLGLTTRDATPAWVLPAAAATRKSTDAFADGSDLLLWERFRDYARSPEIRKLRYVGFPLAKKEPPALDIEEVFVPLEVEVRRALRLPVPEAAEARGKRGRRRSESPIVDKDEDLRMVPFARLGEQAQAGAPQPFAEIFRAKSAIVVLGDPGSGKTTLLRWLAVVAAGGALSTYRDLGITDRLLPLPVSVGALADIRRDLGPVASVPEALTRYFHGRHVGEEEELRAFLPKVLEAGHVLVLLDGLDEVRSSERDEIRAWLETFASRYAKNRFVVSSRHVGYNGFALPEGVVGELRPLTDPQVRRYVEAFTRAYRRWETRWPDAVAEASEAAHLLAAIEQSPRLAALARNPFMLSALALINRAEGRLPRHRVQFYAIFARALCETWGHARRIVAKQPERVVAFEEEAIPILGELARSMHESYPTGIAPQDFVLSTVARALRERRGIPATEAAAVAREFLDRAANETQVLLERGPGRWGFLHLTFQEFFTAAGLHASERFEEEAMRHLFDPRWEEVLRLGVGDLALVQNRPEAARRFVERVLKHRETGIRAPLNILPRKHVALAALLAAEAGDALPRDLQRDIAAALARWVFDMPAEDVSRRVLAEIALTDFGGVAAALFEDALEERTSATRMRTAISALAALRAEGAVLLLVEALNDREGMVRAAAAHALGTLGAEAAVPGLIEALKDKEEVVRRTAAQALAALGAAAAVPALLEALKDKEAIVRVVAVEALETLGAGAAAVPGLIKALKDKEERIRAGAVKALGVLGAATAVPRLIEALKDTQAMVRKAAAEALGVLGAATAASGLTEALKDREAVVRATAAEALEALGAGAATAPGLIEALRDKEGTVRAAAAEALGVLGLGARAAAVPGLIQALRDKDVFVRLNALHALRAIPSERAIKSLVEHANRQSGSPDERATAVSALLSIVESSPRMTRSTPQRRTRRTTGRKHTRAGRPTGRRPGRTGS